MGKGGVIVAVPLALMQKIEEYQAQGYEPSEITAGLAESVNFKEIASKVKFYQAKGYQPNEILDGIRESYGAQTLEEHPISGSLEYSGQTAPQPPAWAAKSPSLYGATGAAWEIAKPNIEMGGLAGGAIAGAVGGPIGAAAGGGLGYAAGKRLTTAGDVFLGNRPPETAREAFTQAGKEAVEGAAMEAGGQVIGKVAPVVGREVAKRVEPIKKWATGSVPEKLYQSSLKMGTTIPPKERAARTATGLSERISPTEEGLGKLEGLKKDIFAQIDDVIKPGAAKGDTVNVDAVISRLDKVRTKFAESAMPTSNLEAIDKIAQDFKTYGDTIPVDQANRIKKNIYQILKDTAYGELKGPQKEAQKAIARGLKEELETLYPGLGGMNKKASEYIKLEDSLERAVGRINNRDIIGLGEQVMSTAGSVVGGAPGAVATSLTSKILGMPRIKARIAMALYKSGSTASKQAMDPAMKKLFASTAAMSILKSNLSDNQKEKFLSKEYSNDTNEQGGR